MSQTIDHHVVSSGSNNTVMHYNANGNGPLHTDLYASESQLLEMDLNRDRDKSIINNNDYDSDQFNCDEGVELTFKNSAILRNALFDLDANSTNNVELIAKYILDNATIYTDGLDFPYSLQAATALVRITVIVTIIMLIRMRVLMLMLMLMLSIIVILRLLLLLLLLSLFRSSLL